MVVEAGAEVPGLQNKATPMTKLEAAKGKSMGKSMGAMFSPRVTVAFLKTPRGGRPASAPPPPPSPAPPHSPPPSPAAGDGVQTPAVAPLNLTGNVSSRKSRLPQELSRSPRV